jgi:hypothetical protein
VADAVPRPLVVDDDDVERMLLQEKPQCDSCESGGVSKPSDGLVIVTFFAVGVVLVFIFFLVWLLAHGVKSG